jgi:DNA-binding NarL/FixJ family response regulator
MNRVRVLLADDHALVLEGLRRVLEPEFNVVGSVADGLSLLKAAEEIKPDLIVVDVSMPLLNGIEAVRQIRAAGRFPKIVFLSMHPDVLYASEALQAGGSAYVLKSSAGTEIITAIRQVLEGGTFVTDAIDRATLEARIRRDRRSDDPTITLSSRQREIVQMVAEGRSTKNIAEVLRISNRTVEFHRYRAMKSLGVHTLAELVQYAIAHHLVFPNRLR